MATSDKRKRTRPPAKVNPMRRATDIEDVRFPTRAVVGLVLFTAALVGGQWAITAGLRTDIAAIVSRMDAQERINGATLDAARKVQEAEKHALDDKLQNLEKKIDDVDRNYKLGDYDIKALITTVRK